MEQDVFEQHGISVVGAAPEMPEAPPPALVQLAKRSFMFRDMDSAHQFQSQMQASAVVAGGNGSMLWDLYNASITMADQYGGQMFRSTYGREVRVYGYQRAIYEADREYLFDRDTSAGMLVEQYDHVWNGLPLTFVPEVDAYFAEQIALGLQIALQAGYQEYWQCGGSFAYLETDRDPGKRVARGERPVQWCYLPAGCIIDDMKDPQHAPLLAPSNNVDPLLDHGIEEISFYPTAEARMLNQPVRVHGSRLIAINLDPRKQKWWRTNHIRMNRVYDTLWDKRDVMFSHVRGHFQGDPIVVDVDISEDAQRLLNIGNMTQPQRDKMSQDAEQAVVDYNTGAKSSFAPVMGFKLRRLGAAQLQDPKEVLMALSSQLAQGSIYPIKFFLASTKGASDVSDQDILILQGNVQNVRNTWGYKHLAKALLMGQVMGVNGLRMQSQFTLPHPHELQWPPVRPLSPRDAAFTEKTDVAIVRELQEASRVVPPRLARKYPEDPRYPTPLWLAARGRDTNGESMDPLPAPAGGGSSAKAEDKRADPELQAWLEGAAPKPKKDDDDEDEDDKPSSPKRPKKGY